MTIRVHTFIRGQRGFTLIELLIVIGLLAALATLVLTNLTYTRTEALDDSLVRKELSDIQRAFQRFVADCAPQQADYKLIARYGLEPLMQYRAPLPHGENWSFENKWDNDRRKGWRGPYIDSEGHAKIDTAISSSGIPNKYGQEPGSIDVPVINTPYVNDDDGFAGGYYRVIPDVDNATNEVTQLWVVFPSHRGNLDLTALGCGCRETDCIVSGLEPYVRRLMLD